jgi:cardiolipin synthase
MAEQRVRIATAYFVPDEELCHRLLTARERNVDIEVLVPGPHADKRFVQLASEAVYAPLLDAGVSIWTFQPSMFHAKIMTVDGIVANIGSANLNARSSALDEEINVVVMDDDVVRLLDRQFDEDLERSVHIERRRWKHRSVVQRVAERFTVPVRRVF